MNPRLTVCIVFLFAVPVFAQVSPDELADRARERGRERTNQAEQDLWARSLIMRFENRVDETVELFERLEQRHVSLNEWLDELLTNDDGKRLARDPNVAIQFVAYRERPLLRDADLDAKLHFLEELMEFLNQVKQPPEVGWVPSPEHVEQADDLYLWARDRIARIGEVESWLKATLAGVDLAADVSNDPTLKDRIQQYHAQRHEMWRRLTLEGKAQAEQEAAPRIKENARVAELQRALFESERLRREAAQALETQRLDFERQMKEREITMQEQMAAFERQLAEREAEIERQNLVAAAERQARDVDANIEAKGIEEDAKRRELVSRCRSAEVQRDLFAFLDEGYWQPGDRERDLNSRRKKTPMSYNALKSFGALNKDLKGAQMLLAVANERGSVDVWNQARSMYHDHRHHDQERHKWGYDSRWKNLTRDEIDEIYRIQELLIELGETLVEEGMLAR